MNDKTQTGLADISVMPMPLVNKIKETLRKRILDGTYSVHAKLPSERELVDTFKVSRVTVRQALAALQREGLIFKINGKGTYVSKPKAALDISRLRGFGEAMVSLGYEAFARVLSIQEESASEAVARHLQLDSSSQITKLQRLRYLNREPISLDITHFSPLIGKEIVTADLEARDLISLVENECGVNIGNAKMTIEALLSDEIMSRHLELEEGGPILHIERTIFDSAHQPLLYENLFYRGDVFRYSLDIER